MRKLTRVGGLIGLSLVLCGCPRAVVPPPSPVPGRPPAPAPAPTPPDLRGATVYVVDPQRSQLDIQVFRGGTFSRLGHNHVVTSRHLGGRVWVHPQLARSGFELSFPVAQLVVDDAQARRAAGSEFPPDVPQADKDGTRRNMLKPEVLDAGNYPQVTVHSARIAGTLQAPQVTARITIKNQSRDVQVPVSMTIDGAQLSASGEFDILQSEFGIKPFSVALGALQVADRLHITFNVTATRQP